MDTPQTLSQRALKFAQRGQYSLSKIPNDWGKCQFPDGRVVGWSGRTEVLTWGYEGNWDDSEKAWLEALGDLFNKKKSWPKSGDFSPREVEAYLRDRNSVPAFPPEKLAELSEYWEFIVRAMGEWSQQGKTLQNYRFPSEKNFKTLSLPEKIHELKSFFSSERLAGFYRQGGKIEVLDVDSTTVYIALFCAQIPEGALLDWLQLSAAEVFREPALNLVPEPFPSGTP